MHSAGRPLVYQMKTMVPLCSSITLSRYLLIFLPLARLHCLLRFLFLRAADSRKVTSVPVLSSLSAKKKKKFLYSLFLFSSILENYLFLSLQSSFLPSSSLSSQFSPFSKKNPPNACNNNVNNNPPSLSSSKLLSLASTKGANNFQISHLGYFLPSYLFWHPFRSVVDY